MLHHTNKSNNDLIYEFSEISQILLRCTLLFNAMILLNQTQKNFEGILEVREKYDFLNDIEKGKRKVINFIKNVKKNQNADNIELYLYEFIKCDLFYSDFYNDHLLGNVKKFYIENNTTNYSTITNSLKNFCQTYYFTNEKDIFLIYNHLFKINWNIHEEFMYLEKNYSNLKKIYDSNQFLDLFLVILLIFRPINTFINDNLFKNLINKGVDSYINYIIINLTFNLIAELFFVYLVWKFINNKTNKIDSNLINFIRYIDN